MRIFGDPVRTKRLLQMAGMKEGEVIESGMLTRQIEKAQRKVESHNFDIRKQLLLFDDVANDQRKVVYQPAHRDHGHRGSVGGDRRAHGGHGRRRSSISFMPKQALPPDWDLQGLADDGAASDFNARIDPEGVARRRAGARGTDAARARRTGGASRLTTPRWRASGRRSCATSRRRSMLQKLDQHWREHLARDGVPEAGHSPARLCAEGLPLRVQARGLRAVRRHARSRQVRDRFLLGDASRSAPRRSSSARRRSGASG